MTARTDTLEGQFVPVWALRQSARSAAPRQKSSIRRLESRAEAFRPGIVPG